MFNKVFLSLKISTIQCKITRLLYNRLFIFLIIRKSISLQKHLFLLYLYIFYLFIIRVFISATKANLRALILSCYYKYAIIILLKPIIPAEFNLTKYTNTALLKTLSKILSYIYIAKSLFKTYTTILLDIFILLNKYSSCNVLINSRQLLIVTQAQISRTLQYYNTITLEAMSCFSFSSKLLQYF